MPIRLDNIAINAAFSQPEVDGTFRGAFAEYLGEISKRRPVVLLAFAPKSAGTFLRSAAINAVQGQYVRVVHAQGGREAQPYLPIFINYYYGGVCDAPMVTHLHMQAHPANCRFIEALSLKPIIMIRSIPDMLASMWDMLDRDEDSRSSAVNCYVPEAFHDFSKAEKAEFVADMFASWYVNYYATWLEYSEAKPDTVCVLRFADFLANPAQVLARALRHAGLERPLEVCRSALDATWRERGEYRDGLRVNKGVSGRGKEYFSPDYFARLERMLSHYSILEKHRDELL